MQLFLLALFAGVCTAGRLEPLYLPPSAKSSQPEPSIQYQQPQPLQQPNPVAILKQNNDNNADGSYKYEFETENKISQQEQGQLKNLGTEQEANEVSGSYSYVAPDGQVITVNYVADENGFRPSGSHIPTPPPIPEAIARSLEQNAAEEAVAVKSAPSGLYGAPPPSVSREYLAPQPSQQGQQGGYRY